MINKATLLAWWAATTASAVWGLWGAPPILLAVPLTAATVFAARMQYYPPRHTWARITVYLSALLANQAPSITAATWVLLPGHTQQKITAATLGLFATLTGAVLALATFALVRNWVTSGQRWSRPAPHSWSARWPAIGTGATAAVIYLFAMTWSNNVWNAAERLVGLTPAQYPSASGGFNDWVLQTTTSSLAGFVEEPVFVGLIVLLWPRLKAKTLVPLALLSGTARGSIHLYYASGSTDIATAASLIILGSMFWSSVALVLIYRTRTLWPVIIAHGVSNALATLNGPFTADTSPLHITLVALPYLTAFAIFATAGIYATLRLTEKALTTINRRWPRAGQWPQKTATAQPTHQQSTEPNTPESPPCPHQQTSQPSAPARSKHG
ncbi:CPBP family intramembrane glutamic endopeptidase [Mycolicibacterium fortuitum]|uniref:CPBP family intramembrane glutamic endopeptidase n=1 Tax=Mycolicibacterium fortuitum TaxID=1766 RepID=UPI002611E471|nr:CPBP family intramembrane glutamic endopeptidase [Mycolicibacterium fortuitum]